MTPDEQKCMDDAGTKNGEDILQHCTGVDFDVLKKGDVSTVVHLSELCPPVQRLTAVRCC